jgi:hypothetical protein
MSHYPLALYLHIVGALGFFIALGLEWMSVRRLRQATNVTQVRDWVMISTGSAKVGMPSMLLLLISGALMTVSAWGAVPWVLVTLGAIVLLIILALGLSRRRIAAIGQAVAEEEGPLSSTLRQLTHHPLLWLAIQTRVAIALGVVFLMTVKPDLISSLLTIGVAAGIGLGFSIPLPGRKRVEREPEGSLAS